MHPLELKVPPVALALIVAALMWALARYVPQAAFVPPWREGVALLCTLAGFAIALAGVLEFRRARTTVHPQRPDTASALVRSGIFRHSRNPMYVGILLVLAGWGYHLGNVGALLLLPVFVVYMNRFQIRVEERALLVIFGAEYTDYMRSVRRWL